MPLNILDPVPLQAGDHEDGVEEAFAREGVRQAEQALAGDQVDLVQCQDRPAAAPGKTVEDAAGVPLDGPGSGDPPNRVVCAPRRPPARPHPLPRPAAPRWTKA